MNAPTKRVEIIPAKRRALILEHLRVNGAASITELSEAIGGSQSTVRRDLEHLVEGGYLERTHGGALLVPPHCRRPSSARPRSTPTCSEPQKMAIGGRAAALRLNPRESVIFERQFHRDRGRTRGHDAEICILTVVTNSLDIAQLCSGDAGLAGHHAGRHGAARHRCFLAGEPGQSFFDDGPRRRLLHRSLCRDRQPS